MDVFWRNKIVSSEPYCKMFPTLYLTATPPSKMAAVTKIEIHGLD